MKKIAKILSVVLCMAMVLGLVGVVSAAEESMDIFANKGTLSGKTITWTSTNFEFKNEQDQSTTAIRVSDTDHFRAYAKSKTTISAKNGLKITQIVITTSGSSYNDPLVNSVMTVSGVTTSVSGTAVTISFASPVDSISFNATAQWRLKKIAVTLKDPNAGACTHAESEWGAWQHDDTHHWKTCSCGDTEKRGEAAHNPVNYVCECGYIQKRDLPTDSKAIVDAAFSLQTDEALSKYFNYSGEITLTGVVTQDATWSDSYSNGTVYFDVEGTTETKNMQAYKLVAGAGLTAEDVKGLVVGDTVTISGSVIKNYRGTIEFDGSKLVSVTKAGAGTPPAGDDDDDKDDDVVVTPPAGGSGPIDGVAPTAGMSYKLGVWQNSLGEFYYFAGTTANKDYYMATTTDFNAATDVTVESVEGGYRLSFMDGTTKKYLDIYKSGTYVNIRITEEPTAVFTWNATHKTFVANVEGEDYYMGTYTSYNDDGSIKGDYSTLSASKLSYLPSDSSYASHVYAEVPAKTGDISSVFVALLAVSAIGAGALISKKGKFVA